MHVCRFCHQYASDDGLVKYGRRHYAHFHCYLKRKPLRLLSPWQVGQFPWTLLKDHGLLAEAAELSRRD